MGKVGKGNILSQRQLRVGELVRHTLTDILSKLDFSDDIILSGKIISVSQVRMSPDLKLATCFVSCLDSSLTSESRDLLAQSLQKKAKVIRHHSTSHLSSMRYLPTFRFLADTSSDDFARVDEILRSDSVQRDIKKADDKADSDVS